MNKGNLCDCSDENYLLEQFIKNTYKAKNKGFDCIKVLLFNPVCYKI